MRRLVVILGLLVSGMLLLAGTGCHRESAPTGRKLRLEAFIPTYNRYIHEWLVKQQAAATQAAAEIDATLATATAEDRPALEKRAKTSARELEKWRFRLGLGDYLKIGVPADVPTDLIWQNGMDQPDIGDPRARKGGTLRRFIPNFPATIRPFGDNSNNEFRGELYDNIDIPLVAAHPETLQAIPGLANEWAVSADGRTVYFRLNPAARYSDGVPVTARDFLVAAYLRVSDDIFNPFDKQHYREDFAQLAIYDDHTLSVSLPETRIGPVLFAGALTPSPPQFYADYGPDYSERYQWAFPPTTGAYQVPPGGIAKGASITQTRVKDWWARDLKYYRYRFNPDQLVNTVIRDESKAFELFRAGELDTFYLTRPDLWYEKCEIKEVFSGYIERTTFFTRYPLIPRGLYLNVRKPPLDNRDVRVGLHHALNWQKVINVMFRGDYQRLNVFNEGYAIYSDPSIKARPYSIAAARAAFAKAGYTTEGPDGILIKPDGTRLTSSVSYPIIPQYDTMFAILREEAKACGFELRLDRLEFTVSYKKEMLKQYEMDFSSWVIDPIIPNFYEFLHSINAIDAKGNPKPQTNNFFVWARADTDELCDLVRTGRTEEEVRDASWKLQQIIHDEGFFAPAYTIDFIRLANWRWVKWPDCENTRFSPPVVLDPHQVHVLWIDEDARRETLAAQHSGAKFPEVNRTADAYRMHPPPPPGNAKPQLGE
jgi:microcin C transport system substrate-binding protein